MGNADVVNMDRMEEVASRIGVVIKYSGVRLYDGKIITGYGYAYNGKTYVTESDAPPHLVNWHEVVSDSVRVVSSTMAADTKAEQKELIAWLSDQGE